jgi:hypothetical protein
MDLSSIKLVEPSPELPGDRALTCAQIGTQMSEIMRKRGMKDKIASSKSKICSARKTLDAQGEEKKRLSATQVPALTAAAYTGGPAAQAVTRKTQAEDAALEARQRPGRDRALASIGSGVGDMMDVMNDPRLMRLSLLAQEHRCGEVMAASQSAAPAASDDGCEDSDDGVGPQAESAPASPINAIPAGAADPFVQRGTAAAKPAVSDPFAKH